MEQLLSTLFKARDVAQVHHWRTKSFAAHLALGELYDALVTFADTMAEMYMGKYGTNIVLPEGPNGFDQVDSVRFISQLDETLNGLREAIPQDGFLLNTYDEIQGLVSQIKYKLENLR